ncbi:MAG: hypothetical protein U9Q97_04995 [Acidobacteriota bacterium]|nr:hypothetical protein [Acidobacteriota bacterium]
MTTTEKTLKFANNLRTSYHPVQLLSENRKTCVSINLPIKDHCTPTERCAADCYGKSGHTVLTSNIKKQKYLSKYLEKGDITLLIYECKQYLSVRLNGVGDLKTCHVPAILSLAEACPQTLFWGMTRKIPIAKEINNKLPNLSLLVTVDISSPPSVWNYDGAMCFGPRREEDPVPDDKRIITVFPRHHIGKIVGNIPEHEKDCPAVRHTVNGCVECRQCWNW